MCVLVQIQIFIPVILFLSEQTWLKKDITKNKDLSLALFSILCFLLGKHLIVKKFRREMVLFLLTPFSMFFIAIKRVLREWRFGFSLGLGWTRFKSDFFAWFLRAKKVFLIERKLRLEGIIEKCTVCLGSIFLNVLFWLKRYCGNENFKICLLLS